MNNNTGKMKVIINKFSPQDYIISLIDKRVISIDDEQKAHIKELLLYHSCEPMAAAERISEFLEVSYSSIFDLL